MYRVEKKFSLPIGHRLSKHAGRCSSIHGHNFSVHVGVKAEELNKNDMVIDFSDLKNFVNEILDEFDHCLVLNKTDLRLQQSLKSCGMRTILLTNDPTAERLSELIYQKLVLKFALSEKHQRLQMDYVIVYENENSKATYTQE